MLLFDSVGHYFRLRREMLSGSRFTVLLPFFFLDNREKNMPSFLPPGRAYRGSNARHPCSMAVYAVAFALFFGTRDGRVAFIYIYCIEIW